MHHHRAPASVADAPAGDAEPTGDAGPRLATASIASPAELAILAYAAAILLLWAPMFNIGLLSPRMAVVFVGLGPGLVVVAGLARRGDRTARWAAAYLAWALLAVLLAPHPRSAFLGTYGTDEGWLYTAGFFGAWGLGRRLGGRGRSLLPKVLLGGVLINSLFGILEAAVEPVGDLAPIGGRVLGLFSNPLFLGGLLVGGLALVGSVVGRLPEAALATSDGRRKQVVLLAVAVPLTMAANLTGSRASLVFGALIAVAAAFVGVRAAGGGAVVRRVGLVGVAVVLGFLLSIPLQGSGSSTSRLGDTSTSSGYASRGIMWKLGIEAAAERPVAGWGPGRFREATASKVTRDFVIAEGPDKLFYDAHNLVIQELVATGVIGLGLLGMFGWRSVRRCRGPLAWFAGGVALTWLLNPVSACTGPLVLLALGASHRSTAGGADDPAELGAAGDPPVGRRAAQAVGAVLALVGVLFGARLLVADAYLDKAVASASVPDAEAADRFWPDDAVVANLLAQARSARASDDPTPANRAAVIRATERSIRLDPTREHWWNVGGYAQLLFSDGTRAERIERAQPYFEEALRRSPYSAEAMNGLLELARLRHDSAAEQHWRERLCAIEACPTPEP